MRKYDSNQLLSDEQKPNYQQILKQILNDYKKTMNNKYSTQASHLIVNKIKQTMTFKEDKIFTLFAGQPIQFFNVQWNFISQRLPQAPLNFKNIVIDLARRRVNNVIKDLRQENLIIQEPKPVYNYDYDIDEKNGRVSMLHGQSQQIQKKLLEINAALKIIDGETQQKRLNSPQSKKFFAHLYTEEKKKQVEELIKKKQQQKQTRRKKLQNQRMKQQQQLIEKQKQIKQNEQKQLKLKKEEQLRKSLQLHQKRSQQKAIRQQRKEQYESFLKSINQKPRLFELLQKNYQKKVQYQQMQRKHKMLSQKKARYLNIDQLKIQQHEKAYESVKKAKEEQRQKKYQQFIEEQQRSHIQHHSAFQLQNQLDRKQLEKQRVKQKYQKIKNYQSVIKQKFMPKIDQEKKKQMLTLIEELKLNSQKRLKKIKLEDGKVVYEPIKEVNPRSLGIIYLEKVKQMAVKAKIAKGTSSSLQLPSQPAKKKSIDYLQELRKVSKQRPKRKLSFIDKPNLTFDQKIDKVLIQSQKLNDVVKQNQMKLKFGKFKTSDEILNCKEQIDQSYLDIAKMKIKLIKDN